MIKRLATFRERLSSRRGFVYNVGLLAGSTAAAQLLTIILSPVFTRLYTPDEFGIFGVYISVFGILLAINSLRYEFAIPIPEQERDALALVILTIVLVTLTTIGFEIFFWIRGDELAAAMNAEELRPYLWLLPLSLFGAGCYQAFSFWATRQQTYSDIARSQMTQSVTMNATQLGGGLARSGTTGLLFGHVVGQIAGSLLLAVRFWRAQRTVLQSLRLSDLWTLMIRYRNFPLLTSWSSLLNVVGLNVPRLLINLLFGASAAGLFLFGQRLIALPVQVVGASVGQVFLGTAAKIVKERPLDLMTFYMKTVRQLSLIALLPSIVLLLAAQPVFRIVFGDEWVIAGLYVQILVPAFLVQFVVSSVSQVMFIIERQSLQMFWDIFRLGLVLAGFWMASSIQADATTTVFFYAFSLFIAYIVLFWMQWTSIKAFQLRQQQKV